MSRRFIGDRLLLATHNAGKLAEFVALLALPRVHIVSADALGLPAPVETEESFLGNARLKAHAAVAASGLPSLADDSGLEVEALGGAPGVHTADWAEGPNGRDFVMAMNKLHQRLIAAGAPQPWRARFRCTLVLAWPGGHEETAEGTCSGALVWPRRGADGHGFDPMFLPDGFDQTFSEMPPELKNRLSHRARALAELRGRCFT